MKCGRAAAHARPRARVTSTRADRRYAGRVRASERWIWTKRGIARARWGGDARADVARDVGGESDDVDVDRAHARGVEARVRGAGGGSDASVR